MRGIERAAIPSARRELHENVVRAAAKLPRLRRLAISVCSRHVRRIRYVTALGISALCMQINAASGGPRFFGRFCPRIRDARETREGMLSLEGSVGDLAHSFDLS